MYGLIPPKKEYIGKRRFSYAKYFGSPLPIDVPDFMVGKPIRIKNQGGDGTCVSFALSSVSEDQEGFEIEPAYIWYKISKLAGYNPFGADPDVGCKVLTKFGSLSVDSSPFHLPEDGSAVALNIWDSNLDRLASMQKKKSWFEIDGPGDRFDNIRQVLWTHASEKVTAFCGIYWQPVWDFSDKGRCENFGGDKSRPHAIKILGQKTIDGVPYLVVQNSWGESFGDGGLFYFSREVANKLMFARGFFDVDPEDVKQATWGILEWLKNWAIGLLKSVKTPQELPEIVTEPIVVPPIEVPTEPKNSLLVSWAKAIEIMEGTNKSWNNPGAIRDKAGKFLKFSSYQAGFSYLCDYLTRAATGKHSAYPKGGETTLLEFQHIYSPSYDNNDPDKYAKFVAGKIGVSTSTKIKELL